MVLWRTSYGQFAGNLPSKVYGFRHFRDSGLGSRRAQLFWDFPGIPVEWSQNQFSSPPDRLPRVARPRHRESGEVSLRQAPPDSRTRGHDQERILGTAARHQCHQEHSYHARFARGQRTHGQLSSPDGEQRQAAEGTCFLRFGRVQVDRSGRLRPTEWRFARTPSHMRKGHG